MTIYHLNRKVRSKVNAPAHLAPQQHACIVSGV